ncbi:hypothetical protein AMATHDRAFT_149124 [Amanita thiersii Skay4041]|uniref:Uncharacterized protein n=1 Tax=Amanita thiersii Skay4041 TaxID=703135 RepID=A0A2A9NLZ1_9AGAR|nr:hypothetical protein AMATHDRAFT_149124 [Amanita thiersii Skay4041]
MATPSSSATSPSPPMAYLTHTPTPLHLSTSAPPDALEREHRKKAVQKFLARAEISMVTRALRARLSYASYKATHNIPHATLCELEARVIKPTIPSTAAPRTTSAKRKAAASNKDAATINSAGLCITGSSLRRGGSGSMAPPASVSSPRNIQATMHGNIAANLGQSESGPSSRSGQSAPSLYKSILAPPPTKQARTIHNAGDPPIPPPSRTAPSPRTRAAKPTSRGEGRTHARGKSTEHPPKVASSPARRRGKTASLDKGKRKQALADAEMNVDADADVDMKAAATLTSWLLHNRQPNMTGSASSPRSSFGDSDTGSTYSHFAQSSARTTTGTAGSAASSVAPSTTSVAEGPARSRTPSPSGKPTEHVTPRAAPTDDEAADLMLLFAASPSPARPTTTKNKAARDLTAFRTLTGGNNSLANKGRVLFPSSTSGDGEDSVVGAPHLAPHMVPSHGGAPLTRSGENSFTSSISSISLEMGRRGSTDLGGGGGGFSRVSSSQFTPSQLLPPPPMPLHESAMANTARTPGGSPVDSLKSSVPSPKSSGGRTAEFNFSDFINASPSPLRPGATTMLGGMGSFSAQSKPSLGLRADVGRKLFEEEQMRHVVMKSPSGKREERTHLGAGIDLDVKRS